MGNKTLFIGILILTLFCIIGCVTPTAVPYSFAGNDSENGTAAITFLSKGGRGVDLHYFENTELPIPEGRMTFWGRNGYYWAPVIFPAGRPFKLTVNVWYSATDKGNSRIFNCPALTAGGDYTLEIQKGVLLVPDKLVLRDAKTKAVVYEQQL